MVIIPGIHLIKLNFVNAYLIEEPKGLTLIDTGIPGSYKKIIEYIVSLGRKVTDIKTILVTHSDPDHIGSLAKLKELSCAKVCSSATEAEGLRQGRSTRRSKPQGFKMIIRKILMAVILRIKPVKVDKVLKDKDALPIFKGLVAIDTNGHTPGHMSYFLKVPKVLFCGDSMNGIEGKLTSSRPMYTADAKAADKAFKKQLGLKPRIICCGHGEVIRNRKA